MQKRYSIHCLLFGLPLAALAASCGSSDEGTAPTTGAAGSAGASSGAGGGSSGSSTASTSTSSGATSGAGGSSGATGTAGSAGSTSTTGTAGTGGNGGAAGSGGTADAGGGNLDATDGRDCGPGGPLVRPTAPAAIDPPAAAMLVARLHADGTQIYTCTASAADGGTDAASTYAWTLKAPQATLVDSGCTMAGTHFAGPTWQSTDGSSVVGARLASAASTTANSIPLLLLQATRTMGEGIFANVTFVQRLDTKSGNAPPDGCGAATVGTETSVGYSANYYFYAGGALPAEGGSDAAAPDASGD
jgi:hypothetical protein